MRTESPDNDSAFSDNISMLSSESSASSGASAARTDASSKSSASNASSTGSSTVVAADEAARLKAEKIRLALEKMREANVKKLYIKAFTMDGSTKSLLVDEKMTVGHVTRLLSEKNHVRMEPKWVLVEHLPELYMERVYEDNEMLVDQLMLWTRDSRNTLLFVERPDKYNLFSRPEDYLLSVSSSEKDRHLDDDARHALLEEFFSGTGGNGVGVPEIEGPLYLKAEGKKAWKRFYFVLRASGIYYSPKGKSTSKSSKDLVCLATFDVNQVYTGVNWRKKFKAPTDFGLAIKHPKLQSRSSKFIKYLCAEDERTMARWVMGIRIAKHGRALMDNYRALVEELAQEDLDQLANARSFSLASMTMGGSTTPTVTVSESLTDETETPVNTLERGVTGFGSCTTRPLSRQDSLKSRASNSSSSGCLSERSSTGTATPTFENAFDSDFPMGTIKRKPSMTPKLPLTTTTRLLVKELEDTVDGQAAMEARNTLRQSFRKSLNEEVSTIRRKTSNGSVTSHSSVSTIISSNIQDCPGPAPIQEMDDLQDVDSLPLPPPPTFNSPDDGIGCDSDLLPPPPPEAFDQVDSGSFPLPPDELIGVSCEQHRPFEHSMSPRMLRSKPPSPTPQPPVVPATLKPCLKSSICAPTVPPKPALMATCKRESINNQAIYANSAKSNMPAPPPLPSTQSPSKKNRRITFDERVACSPSPPPMNSPPKPPKPPTPPKRVDPLRSSLKQPIPQKLTAPGCTVTPPREFLKDLQRVMQKKWQVAQKCKDDTEVTPHSVLGFRDQPPPIAPVPAAYKENSVRAWVAEHYGSGSDVISSDNNSMGFYENVFVPSSSTAITGTSGSPGDETYQNCVELRREYTHPYLPAHQSHTLSARMSSASTATSVSTGSSKRLPPPPPKRSETTHLSTRIH